MHESPRRVAIIGAGFSGVVTAIRMLAMSLQPVQLLLLDQNPAEAGAGGIAYSEGTTDWEMLLNLQASRISIFREDVDDFLRWVNLEADRTDWPLALKSSTFAPASAVPRRVYGRYLRDRLRRAVEQAQPGVTLEMLSASVTSVTERTDNVALSCIEVPAGTRREIHADKVVLATGHLRSKIAEAVTSVASHPRYISDPYTPAALQSLRSVQPEGRVLVLGTGLTAYDTALLLRRNGHTGPIVLSSRGGNTHFAYRPGHAHEILKLPRPVFMDTKPMTLANLAPVLLAEYAAVKKELLLTRPDIDEKLASERILKAWEPYVPELVSALPPPDVRRALRMYKSLLTTTRIGTVPEITTAVQSAEISIVPAQLKALRPCGHDMIEAVFTGREQESEVYDMVICALGYSPEYALSAVGMWKEMIEIHGSAVPHRITSWGVEVNEFGQLIGQSGSPSTRLYAVGPMRQGDELVRNGRLGAFVFSIGTLRNQAALTAWAVLNGISSTTERMLADIERYVKDNRMLIQVLMRTEAQLLTAKLRRERELALLNANTNWCAAEPSPSIQQNTSTPTPETLRGLRQYLQVNALRHLTDISIIAGQAKI